MPRSVRLSVRLSVPPRPELCGPRIRLRIDSLSAAIGGGISSHRAITCCNLLKRRLLEANERRVTVWH